MADTILESTTLPLPFLTGGGETGTLIRTVNWSNTSLGKPETWPLHLRTAISIMLSAPSPMYLIWGKEYLQFYNDAYIPILGVSRHPQAIGQSVYETFPNKWQLLQPVLENIMKGRPGTLADARFPVYDNNTQELSLNGSFSPVYNETGTIDGIFITVKNSDKLIEEAELRLRLALEATNLGTFDWDLVTKHFSYSQRLGQIFEFEPNEEVDHDKLTSCFHPDDIDVRHAAVKASLITGSLDYEARVISKDKVNVKWVKVSGKLVYNDACEPIRMHGTVTDITAEKTMLLALEESQNRLNIAVDATRLGLYDTDIKSSTLTVSQRVYEIHDFPPGLKITRKDIHNSIHPDDRHIRDRAHEFAAKDKDGVINYEARVVWRDKSIHWVKVNSKLIFEGGEPVRIIGTVMDITEQKSYIHHLEESENRFKIIANTAPVMLWMSDSEMVTTFLNKSWLTYTGRTLEQELGDGWLEGVHPEDTEYCREVFTNAFYRQEAFYMEYRIRRHDGVYRWIADTGIPRIDNNGVFLGHIGRCVDIDEQKQLNERLTKSEARLRIAALSGELGTWDYNPITKDLYWDDACGKMFGVPGRKSSLSLLFSIVDPADLKIAAEQAKLALDPNISGNLDLEFRISDADGNVRWINGKGKAFFENGVAYRFAGTVLDITEKKLALQALQSSELLFKTIANTSPVGLWLTDEVGNNTFVNNTWVEWTGIPFEEQLNAGWLSVVLEEDKAVLNEFMVACSAKKKYTAEFRYVNKQNEICWCMTEGYPYYHSDGNFAGYAGSVTDITAQKKAMDQLKKSEERFKLLANTMPQMIWTANVEGTATYYNQSFYNYTGHTEESIFREGGFSIIHPTDRKQNIDRWMHSVRTGEDYFFEHRFKRNDGVYRWQLTRALPQRDANGNIQMWIGTSTDIHDQKLAAEELENKVIQRTAELQQMNEELIHQKEFIEIILDSSLILVMVFDTEMRFAAFNKKCEEVYGIKKEDVLGKKLEDIFPSVKPSQLHVNLQFALAGEPFHESVRRSNINYRYYESYYLPLRNKENEVYATLLTSHDITDIVQSTEKVKEAYYQLEEKNKALERSNQELESFSYVASHDLQEPLRKIQTFIELLHGSLDNKAASEKYFEKITSSAKRMAILISDVLNYSKLSKQDDHYVSVDLDAMLEDVKTDFELLIKEKHATIINNTLPVIKGIPPQLHQLFTNLLSNALKFSNEHPVITIHAAKLSSVDLAHIDGLDKASQYVHIAFSDNGIGFEQQFAEKIFTIFQRLNNRSYSGTGIGLALCKKIVENHNGHIQAISEPGQGATFNIYLPV